MFVIFCLNFIIRLLQKSFLRTQVSHTSVTQLTIIILLVSTKMTNVTIRYYVIYLQVFSEKNKGPWLY